MKSKAIGFSILALFAQGLPASAGNAPPTNRLWWLAPAIEHAMQIHKRFPDTLFGSQTTPAAIPAFESDPDPAGLVATDQPAGATLTASNAFFQNLGANQRTCFSCHQPQNGWAISAASVQQRFYSSLGNDPLFRLIDGATCPNSTIETYAGKILSFRLLLTKGLIRVGLPLPSSLTMTGLVDPYQCSNNTTVNVGSTSIYSFYRRPLPSTNFFFQTSNPSNLFMWDGREPSLISQANDATLIHAQAPTAPTSTQQTQMVSFESGIFSAQNFSSAARSLQTQSATGGPFALSSQPFVQGGPQPSAASLPAPFNLYTSWATLTATDPVSAARESIARGEAIFNSTTAKSCGGCHNTVNNGNRDNAANPGIQKFFNTGLANASATPPSAGQGITSAALADLDISGLPVFTVTCNDGSNLQGSVYTVTDLGRAMISGVCADIGAFKAPSLRGLAARAPYFHNGSAATLLNVVNFYNDNFNLGLTSSQVQDLVNFLNTL